MSVLSKLRFLRTGGNNLDPARAIEDSRDAVDGIC